MEWFVLHADAYADSGSIYPRDIYTEELIIPRYEPELTLKTLDLEALKQAKEFIKVIHLSNTEMMFFTTFCGKWLIYERRGRIDEVWSNLTSAIESGRLPYDAKVSTAKDNVLSSDKDLHVVCVYTPNYLFREDVRNCRKLLSELGYGDRLYYKPDVMTTSGMYRVTGSRINHRYFE